MKKAIQIVVVFGLLAGSVWGLQWLDYRKIGRTPLDRTAIADTIRVHFIHGSVAEVDCPDQRVRLGGKWGGHIEIQIDSVVYGFEIKDRAAGLHWWPRQNARHFNSEFTQVPLREWLQTTQNDRVTSVLIPVGTAAKDTLLNRYHAWHLQPAYDYAFLGMRCTASARDLLAQAGLLEKTGDWATIFYSFYPKLLRIKLLEYARFNNLPIEFRPGIECRDWEGEGPEA